MVVVVVVVVIVDVGVVDVVVVVDMGVVLVVVVAGGNFVILLSVLVRLTVVRFMVVWSVLSVVSFKFVFTAPNVVWLLLGSFVPVSGVSSALLVGTVVELMLVLFLVCAVDGVGLLAVDALKIGVFFTKA